MHRSTVAYLRAFNPQRFGLTVDPFCGGTLPINALVALSLPIQGNAHFATRSDVDVFDAAYAFGELLVLAPLPSRVWHQQRTAQLLRAIAVTMIEFIQRYHFVPLRTQVDAVDRADDSRWGRFR